jgi:hypothetical protein
VLVIWIVATTVVMLRSISAQQAAESPALVP